MYFLFKKIDAHNKLPHEHHTLNGLGRKHQLTSDDQLPATFHN